MIRRIAGGFDPRALVLAGVLATAAALPSMFSTAVSRDFYFFDVTLTSSAAGLTQLYWDQGRGFSDAESSVQPLRIEAAPTRYRFMMPAGDFTGFRLAPNNHDATMTLGEVQIVDKWGRRIRPFEPREFQPNQTAGLRALPSGAVEITPKEAGKPVTLDLRAGAPLRLPVTPRMWIQKGTWIALLCFFFGAALGHRSVATRLGQIFARTATWTNGHPRTGIALAAGLAVLVQAYPVVFLGRSFVSPANGGLMLYGDLPTLPGAHQSTYANTMGSDVGAMLFQHLYYPMAERDALLGHGEIPLWNRYSLAGEPLLGQGQSMFGDPLNALTLLSNGAAWAWDLRFLAAHWLLAAGLGFGVWRLTRHTDASLIVAAASAHIGLYLFRINHPAVFSVAYGAWIPWAWLGFVAAAARRRDQAAWLAALALINWAVLTSGTVKEAAMVMACLNAAGVFLVLMSPETRQHRLALLGRAAGAAIIFALVTAPLWLTFLTTLRSAVTSYDAPSANPFPVSQLIGFFDELFYRQGTADEHVVGPALNFLFLVGMLAWLVQQPWKDRPGLAIALAALPTFALAFGLVPPAIVLQFPFLKNIGHIGDVFSCPLLILVGLLAGSGFARGCGLAAQPAFWRRLAVAGGIGAAMVGAYFIASRHDAKSPFSLGYAGSLIVACLGLAFAARWAAVQRRPGLLYVGIGLAIPILLWRHGQYVESRFNQYVFTPGERNDFHAESPAVAAVDARSHDPARIIGWDLNLFPVYNTALGWESLYGADALRSPYYGELTAALGLDKVRQWDAPTPPSDAAKLQRAHDFLNVRYSVGNRQAGGGAAPAGTTLVSNLDLAIYESATFWPRAFYTDTAVHYKTVAEFATLVNGSDGRPFAAIQRGASESEGSSAETALPGNLTGRSIQPAENYRLTANTTRFVINAPAPGIAVLTETYYPDSFRVTVDGVASGYFRVNHAFKGVVIPSAGRHEVTFIYRPPLFTLSLILSAAGAGLGIIGWWHLRQTAPLSP